MGNLIRTVSGTAASQQRFRTLQNCCGYSSRLCPQVTWTVLCISYADAQQSEGQYVLLRLPKFSAAMWTKVFNVEGMTKFKHRPASNHVRNAAVPAQLLKEPGLCSTVEIKTESTSYLRNTVIQIGAPDLDWRCPRYNGEMESTQLFALLQKRGIAPTAQQPVTLMRHKDSSYPLQKYIGTEALTLYQARQLKRHEPGGLIVAFYGHKNDHGLLLGVWRVIDVMTAVDAYNQGLLDGGFESFEESSQGYFHTLQATDLLADLCLKLEVRWGGRPNSWRRVLKHDDNYPICITCEPPVRFEGICNASLVMAELRMALDDIHWQQGLGGVVGVYLITDEHSGRHYVGSASSGKGVWQRWRDYARTGHGDNIQLVELLRECPGRENEFRLTLLESMPLDTPRPQVIAREGFWKIALGSRTFGLNSN